MKTEYCAAKGTVVGMIEVVRQEICGRGKKITASDEAIAVSVWNRLATVSNWHLTGQDMRRKLASVVRDEMWLQANKEEADRIISRLKMGDRKFTDDFFYDTKPAGCNISRFRSKIVYNIKKTYDVDVSVKEFGDILYTYLWDNGTWGVLDKYSCRSSFFCWLSGLAQHELMKYLEEMRLIKVERERTVGNTRLLGMSVAPETWEYILADLMPVGSSRDVLTATFVKRRTEGEMMQEFSLDADALHRLQKKAEAELKDRLLRSDSCYEELVLRDKSPREIEVSEEFAMEFCQWQETKGNASPLADMLGVDLNTGELQEKVVEFLYSIPDKLKWSDEDRLVWTLRFIENTAPVEVAERLGRKRSWVDTRFHRLNVRFNMAVREWWNSNS